VAAGVRLLWVLYATHEPIPLISGDAYSYYYYGQELAAGHDLVGYVGGMPTAYYPIGYPAVLGGLFWLVRSTPVPDNLPLAGSLLNVALGTLSVGLVFVIARRGFDTRVGLVAAAITAAFPSLVIYSATFQVETTFIFLALGLVAVVVTHDWSTGAPTRARLVTIGALLGVSASVRPFSMLFLVGLVVALLVAGCGWRRIVMALGWVALPLVLVLAPWTIRNLVVMDAPIVFSSNFGDGLCIDRSLDATGQFRWTSHEGCAPPDTPEAERYTENARRGIEFIIEHPEKEVQLIFKRAWYMMEHDHDGLTAAESGTANPFLGHRLRTILGRTADWFFYATLALAAAGVLAFFRGHRPERLFVGIALLSLLAAPLSLYGNTRFHVPALPFLAIAAAIPLARPPFQRVREPEIAAAPEQQRDDGAPARVATYAQRAAASTGRSGRSDAG